jgi:hypothetical protein
MLATIVDAYSSRVRDGRPGHAASLPSWSALGDRLCVRKRADQGIAFAGLRKPCHASVSRATAGRAGHPASCPTVLGGSRCPGCWPVSRPRDATFEVTPAKVAK